MEFSYDLDLVVISVIVAMMASYVALDLASRMSAASDRRAAAYWLVGGALSMGAGIWAMHFVGMLAFRLPIAVSYDIGITLLSLLIAAVVSALALYSASRDTLSASNLMIAGVMMGLGIAAMHYTGMAAIQVNPRPDYEPAEVLASVLIAIVASVAALWIAFRLRRESTVSAFWRRLGGALIMGAAIAGMHYTGMAATRFAPGTICYGNPEALPNTWLAAVVGLGAFLLLTTTLLISRFDALLAEQAAKPSPQSNRNWGWLPVAIVVAIGLGITSIAFLTAYRAEEQDVVKGLEFRVDWRTKDLEAKIKLVDQAMVATASDVGTKPRVEAEEFRQFTSAVAAESKSVASIAWAQPVTRGQRAAFESAAGFPILEKDAKGTRIPAAQRDDYMPIVVQNRFDGRPQSLGLDLSAEPIRRQAMETARDTGVPQSRLTPEASSPAGPTYLTFWPIFNTSPVPNSVDQRRAQLRGYVVGVYRVIDVLRAGIADTPAAIATTYFYLSGEAHQPPADSARLVATYSPTDRILRAAQAPAQAPPAEYSYTGSFEVRGQQWRQTHFFSPAAVAAERSSGPYTLLIAGLLLTTVLALYVAGGIRRVSVVQTLVDQRTAELRKTNTQLNALIDASPHAIVCIDAQRRVILWNASAERLFGYTAEEVIGRPYPLVLSEEEEEFRHRLRRLASGEILRNLASHRRHRDGIAIDTSSSAAAFYDAAGKVSGIIFAIEDTRERTEVQSQLRQAQKMEAIGQLTGGLAHDFNNLLGVMLGNLDLLAERFDTDGEERQLTEAAIQAATRGAELIRQLLAFSRKQPLTPKHTDLLPVLEASVHLLRRSLGENIKLDLKVSEAIWPVLIDVTQLESTLLNLAVNARDAMPGGGRLTIEASNVVIDEQAHEVNLEATPGDYVLIAVSDTGTGMSAEVLSHVFEPFFTTKGGKGTGLGLSMVHGFIKQSGGYSGIYSEPGRGTTIRMYLPRALEVVVAKPESVPTEILARGHEMILVVEDNEGIRDLAIRHLQSLGYRTIPAADGAAALEIIEGGVPIDLLFTDVIMPGGLDGRALADAARRRRPGLKVLFTSGFTAAAATAATENPFVSNLLSKPYRKSELARRIRAALDARG